MKDLLVSSRVLWGWLLLVVPTSSRQTRASFLGCGAQSRAALQAFECQYH